MKNKENRHTPGSHAETVASIYEFVRGNAAPQLAELLRLHPGILKNLAPEPETPLMMAARLGHKESLHVLLEQIRAELIETQQDAPHVGVDAFGADNKTALMKAVMFGNRECAEMLIAAGADVDFCVVSQSELGFAEECGPDAVSLAVRYDQHECLDMLLKHDAFVKRMDAGENSLIHQAAAYGYAKSLELLLPCWRDAEDELEGAMFLAAERGHDACVHALIKAGVSPDSTDDFHDETALYAAARNGHDLCVALLVMHGATPDMKTRLAGDTPLIAAIRGNHNDCVLMLLMAGANAGLPDFFGCSPITWARHLKQESCIRSLLEFGAGEKAKKDKSQRFGYPLLRQGGDCHTDDAELEKVLLWAVQEGCAEIVREVLSAGICVNARDLRGYSALMLASALGHLECVILLLNAGAFLAETNEEEENAMHLAAARGHVAVVQYLARVRRLVKSRDSQGNTPLHLAAAAGFADCVRVLADSHADLDARNHRGLTPLMLAAEKGRMESVSQLMAAGASLDVPDQLGYTAMHRALKARQFECAEQLLLYGAAPGHVEGARLSPLMEAAFLGHARCVRHLMAVGANPKEELEPGVTALTLARLVGHEDCARLLEQQVPM